MAEAEKIMSVSADDIEKIMGVEPGDIETIMGVEVPSGAAWQGDRAIFAGGFTGSAYTDLIMRFGIASHGTAVDLGNLSVIKMNLSGVSNITRCVFMGGYGDAYGMSEMDIVTVASTADATDGGDYGQDIWGVAPMSNGTRGVGAGGRLGAGSSDYSKNYIRYFTIASVSGASDFGDLPNEVNEAAGISNATRGVVISGYSHISGSSASVVPMSYITIGTTGNASDFGDVHTAGRSSMEGAESTVRGLFAGGNMDASPYDSDDIGFITVASTGDSANQGDLTAGVTYTTTAVNANKVLIIGQSGGYDTLNDVYTFSTDSGGASDTNDDLSTPQRGGGGCQGY